MKGQSWVSPRGPMSIDAGTRDPVQDIYIREVKEVASFDKVLDGIPCVVKFEKDVNNHEYVVVNSPFGFCADGQPRDGTIGTGEFECDAGVDPTFLGKRTVKLANRGDAKSPKLLLLVSTREATACAIKSE